MIAPHTTAHCLGLGLHELLGARVRNSWVRHLASWHSGPTALFDKFSLFPRISPPESCQFRGCVGLLHEALDADWGEGGDHGRISTLLCHRRGSAAENPSQP